jgi:hypothetical protein
MLPNEEFALACLRYYEEQGIVVDATNGEFAHCPLPREMGDEGYFLLWEHHQQQGLLQSRDVGRCCFFPGHAKKWLKECDYWPDNYFELWEIYEEFSRELTASLWRNRSAEEKEEIAAKSHSPLANLKRKHSMRKVHSRKLPQERKRLMASAVKAICKPVEVTFADGRIGVYPSLIFATRALGFGRNALPRMMRAGRKIKRGPYRGMSARFL